jgi:xylitol oxidase
VQGGVPGPWHGRLPHFRLEFTPSNGDELQSEYLLPREHVAAALRALEPIAELIASRLMVCEIRTMAADELWLSMNYQRESCGFHFTWLPGEEAVAPVLLAIEQALEQFDARPHWGKVFSTTPERLHELYPRLGTFERIRQTFDPLRKFRNDLLDRVFA